MSKHKPKSAQRCELKPWLSANADCKEGRFIQVGNSFLLSRKVQHLSFATRWTYQAMCMESAGRNRFKFPESALQKYGIPSRTGRRGIDALIEAGFIERTCSGKNTRTPSEYCFCYKWKDIA